LSEAINGQRRGAPFFRPDQIDAMHKAFEQVRTKLRLRGPKAMPVAELVAIRIVELAHAGEFDTDKLIETVLAEFGG
jgi:DNA repair protein RadC